MGLLRDSLCYSLYIVELGGELEFTFILAMDPGFIGAEDLRYRSRRQENGNIAVSPDCGGKRY